MNSSLDKRLLNLKSKDLQAFKAEMSMQRDFNEAVSVNGLFEKYLDSGSNKMGHKAVLSKLIELKRRTTESDFSALRDSNDVLMDAAEPLVPRSERPDSERALQETLGSDVYIESYLPQKV
jgi:hypothetical protein